MGQPNDSEYGDEVLPQGSNPVCPVMQPNAVAEIEGVGLSSWLPPQPVKDLKHVPETTSHGFTVEDHFKKGKA